MNNGCNMNRRNVFLLGAGLAVITGTLILTFAGPGATPDAASPAGNAQPDKTGTHRLVIGNARQSPATRLPQELIGLEPKAPIAVDDDNHLIPDRRLRTLFDFHLANLDREPMDLVLSRLRASLNDRLTEPALSQALDILSQYVDYRLSLAELDQSLPPELDDQGFDIKALRMRQQALQSTRAEHFSAQAHEAFFGEEEQLDDYTLSKLEIEQNPALTEPQKTRQLAQLENALPDTVQQTRTRGMINAEVFEKAETMRSKGATDADVFQLRAQNLGETAATNLAQLDQQQQQWQQRLDHYQREKAGFATAGLSEQDRVAALRQLQQQLFSGPEQLRVRALDAEVQRSQTVNRPE